MALLLALQDVEVQVPQLDAAVVEAAEEVGVVETEAEDEAVATVAAHPRLLVAPDLRFHCRAQLSSVHTTTFCAA